MARILFGAPYFSYYRNYDSVVRELAARGHQIHLTADAPETLGGHGLVERLAAEYPDRVTIGFAPGVDAWRWTPVAAFVRRSLEYVRFLDPYYDEIPKYRYRGRDRAPRLFVWLFRVPGANRRALRGIVAACLSWLERAIPAPPALIEFVRDARPDVVLLAGITTPGAPQLDHMKAAMTLGVPTGMTVWSWDHLSGKAWIRIAPDRVFVWNPTQRDEALRRHGLPEDCIVVTGAQCYDQWFDRTPSRPRETFLRAHGLDPAHDLLVYVCSVLVRPAPDEGPFVLEWIRQIRGSSDARLHQANILIRPHPERLTEWQGVDFTGLGRVAVAGANPIDRASRDEYFDSLYHGRAIVGLVTSAFLEAAVVGRPVFTVMKPEYRLFQMGTPHFRYLLTVEGGLVHTADDWPAHIAQLTQFLDNPAPALRQLTRFVTAFVRPHGSQTSGTSVFADTVEGMPALAPAAAVADRSFGQAPGRVVAEGVGMLLRTPLLRLALMSRADAQLEEARQVRAAEERATKARLRRVAQRRSDDDRRTRDDKLRQKAASRQQKAAIRLHRERARRRHWLKEWTDGVWARVRRGRQRRADV